MMPPRKKTEPEFPPESCGACAYCIVTDDEDMRERQGMCFALPPYVIQDHVTVRPIVEWTSTPCVYFKLRTHA